MLNRSGDLAGLTETDTHAHIDAVCLFLILSPVNPVNQVDISCMSKSPDVNIVCYHRIISTDNNKT